MSQISLAFDSSLQIRDEQGRYQTAIADQILAVARKVMAALVYILDTRAINYKITVRFAFRNIRRSR